MINLQSILVKIKNKLVKIVNTTRIPRLVDFILKPTLKMKEECLYTRTPLQFLFCLEKYR